MKTPNRHISNNELSNRDHSNRDHSNRDHSNRDHSNRDHSNRDILKKAGIKYSRQRNEILSTLRNYRKPLTTEKIYEECKKTVENLSLSTVYRILNTFVENGIAVKTNLDVENRALFELERHEHKHHLLCLGCNSMVQISSCPLHQYEKELQDKMGYHITSHKLEIYGYCPECRKELKDEIVDPLNANRDKEAL